MKQFKKYLEQILTVNTTLLGFALTMAATIILQFSFFTAKRGLEVKIYMSMGIIFLLCSITCGFISILAVSVDRALPKRKMKEIAINYDSRPYWGQILFMVLSIMSFTFIVLDLV